MKTRSANTAVPGKNITRVLIMTAAILLVPLVAMQFSDEVAWSAADFVVAGGLLLSTGLIYELAVKRIRDVNYRAVMGLALLAVLALIWAELAVGIFGTPFAGS
jgi:hypothetical protein